MAQHVHVDQAIAAVAVRQHGNVTRQQLLAAGLTSPAITYRVRSGRLFRLFNGIYAVGRPPTTPLERASAALLVCGPTAALSHESAMVLWDLWKRWPTTLEVSVIKRRGPRGVTVHHPTTLALRDVTAHRGLRTTTAARTLLDIATTTPRKTLTRAVNNALGSPHLTESQLADLLARNPTHPATRMLQPYIAETQHGLTRSELEDAFKHFGKTQNLPPFKTNVLVHGYLVDVYFPHEQLIVEVDSWGFHKDRRAFETDRTRDADALTHGIPTVRITHERLEQAPDAEAARLQTILENRRQMLSRTRAPQPDDATATPAAPPPRRRAPNRRAR